MLTNWLWWSAHQSGQKRQNTFENTVCFREWFTSGYPGPPPLGPHFLWYLNSLRGGSFGWVDHGQWAGPWFSQNSVGRPTSISYGPAHSLQAGPKYWLGRPTGPFCDWDPWHQPSPKTAFLGPFLGRFACSMVILEALSQGFFSMDSSPISMHFYFFGIS